MKKLLFIICLFSYVFAVAQDDNLRLQQIENRLEILTTEVQGLTEQVKTEINVNNITLSNFLLAVSNVHRVNINVSPELNSIQLTNNFSNVTVKDLLLFLCKEYNLTIDFTGSILSVKRYKKELIEEEKIIPISYNSPDNSISLDIKNDILYEVFRKIIDETGKNLVFAPGLENKSLTAYIQQTPFDDAMNKLAFANNLFVKQSKDGFYVFEDNTPILSNTNNAPKKSTRRNLTSNFHYKIINPEEHLLEVNFKNAPLSDIISEIAENLQLDIFTATPLDEAGYVTFKAKKITFDNLLDKLFEIQTTSPRIQNSNNNSNNNSNKSISQQSNSVQKFSYKKEGSIYFFGTERQLSVRKIEIIHLQHRSVELLSDPLGGISASRIGGQRNYSTNSYGYNNNNNYTNRNRETISTNVTGNFNTYGTKAEALINIMPDEIKQDLDIKVDFELNSFYVNGPSTKIERFKEFINKIDKPVPVVLIEVMLLEVNNNSTVETGVSWGIGNEPTTTQGDLFPETNLTLGAETINKVIGGFDGFGSFNIGQVVPNFFATIKAMESNGNLKIRSTPKLSTLNGHRATFSNGQTSYYAVTMRNIYGTDNPQTSEITNYEPIDAELGLTIKPLVSGDGQVTLDIFVIQSSFGNRISEDAPPDVSSREFSSIIRVKDQDIVVLGGLEEQMKSNSGSGVPLLARVPVIKWLFSKRTREAKKAKLTVLIKPTIIN